MPPNTAEIKLPLQAVHVQQQYNGVAQRKGQLPPRKSIIIQTLKSPANTEAPED